jgi:hypothetical protein
MQPNVVSFGDLFSLCISISYSSAILVNSVFETMYPSEFAGFNGHEIVASPSSFRELRDLLTGLAGLSLEAMIVDVHLKGFGIGDPRFSLGIMNDCHKNGIAVVNPTTDPNFSGVGDAHFDRTNFPGLGQLIDEAIRNFNR